MSVVSSHAPGRAAAFEPAIKWGTASFAQHTSSSSSNSSASTMQQQQQQQAGVEDTDGQPNSGSAAVASDFEEEWRVISIRCAEEGGCVGCQAVTQQAAACCMRAAGHSTSSHHVASTDGAPSTHIAQPLTTTRRYPTVVLQHEGKRIDLYALVCGNFVGVRGRKLEGIRSQLGTHGFHLRVNHQLVEADEVRCWLFGVFCVHYLSTNRHHPLLVTYHALSNTTLTSHFPSPSKLTTQHNTFVAVQVSVLRLVMDKAVELLIESFTAAAQAVLSVHPHAGTIDVTATTGGQQVHSTISGRGLGQQPLGSAAAATTAPAPTPDIPPPAQTTAVAAAKGIPQAPQQRRMLAPAPAAVQQPLPVRAQQPALQSAAALTARVQVAHQPRAGVPPPPPQQPAFSALQALQVKLAAANEKLLQPNHHHQQQLQQWGTAATIATTPAPTAAPTPASMSPMMAMMGVSAAYTAPSRASSIGAASSLGSPSLMSSPAAFTSSGASSTVVSPYTISRSSSSESSNGGAAPRALNNHKRQQSGCEDFVAQMLIGSDLLSLL